MMLKKDIIKLVAIISFAIGSYTVMQIIIKLPAFNKAKLSDVRSLMPENTIPARIKNFKPRVATSETVTPNKKYKQVIGFYDLFLNHKIATAQFSSLLIMKNKKNYNIFKTFFRVRRYDAVNPYSLFSLQERSNFLKPFPQPHKVQLKEFSIRKDQRQIFSLASSPERLLE